MERDFWLSRWQNNRTGFHEPTPNAFLTAHFSALDIRPGGRIFLPLCGKSRDAAWLCEQGFTVVGVELSRLAVTQFFAESGLVPEISSTGSFERFEAGGVTLFAGDIFDLDPETLGTVDAVYDRAALVALPETMRRRYAPHLIALTKAAPQLLVTLEYEQSHAEGPPFSVPETELLVLYDGAYRPESVEVRDITGGFKGRCPARERVWVMPRRWPGPN